MRLKQKRARTPNCCSARPESFFGDCRRAARTRTHTRTNTRTRARTLIPSYSHARTQTRARARTHTHTRVHATMRARTNTCARSHGPTSPGPGHPPNPPGSGCASAEFCLSFLAVDGQRAPVHLSSHHRRGQRSLRPSPLSGRSRLAVDPT